MREVLTVAGVGFLMLVLVVGPVFCGLLYGGRRDERRREQWTTAVTRGMPPRVVITAEWQMAVLAGLGYVPEQGFRWSTWGGPSGCYVKRINELGVDSIPDIR